MTEALMRMPMQPGLPPGMPPATSAPAMPRLAEGVAPPASLLESDYSKTPAAWRARQIEKALGQALEQMSRPSVLAARIETLYEERRHRRLHLENEWIEAWHRYNGEYTGAIAQALSSSIGRSKLWLGLTRWKTDSAHADIMDVLRNPGGDAPWGIDPERYDDDYPIPPALQEAGISVQMLRDACARRAERMQIHIGNQLDAADFDEALDLTCLEMCIAGTGALMGPITVREDRMQWKANWDVNLKVSPSYESAGKFRPDLGWVSVFNAYPDMEVPNVQDSSGIVVVVPETRAQFMARVDAPGHNAAAVLKVLREHAQGNYQPTPAMLELRRMAGDAQPSVSNLFRVLHFFGDVLGIELKQAGVEIPDDLLYCTLRAEIITCGRYLLFARPLLGQIPVYLVPYRRRGTTGPFGVGVPWLIRGSQDGLNATIRMIVDNMSIASGPVIERNMRLVQLTPGRNPYDVYGWMTVLSDHDGHSGKRGMLVTSLPAYTDIFLPILHEFLRLADFESEQPAQTGGIQGLGSTRTATGMSILQSASQKTRNQTVNYIDDYLLEPLIEAMLDWNHRFGGREDILGDMRVIARGSRTVLARELASQRLLQAMQIVQGNPEFMMVLRKDETLREFFKSLGLPVERLLIPPEEQMALEMGLPPGSVPTPGAGLQRALMANASRGGDLRMPVEDAPPIAPGAPPAQPISPMAPPAGMMN